MSDDCIRVLYHHSGNQVEYKITQMPDDYQDHRTLYFYKRTKEKEEWGKWEPVTCVEWHDPTQEEAHCEESECDECGGNTYAQDNAFHDLLMILIEDATIFKSVYSKGKKRLKEQIDKLLSEDKKEPSA